MRFLLRLFSGKEKFLPVNYQYEFSSWIYKIIHCGNHTFADWLHNHGYYFKNKGFKLFTFSNLLLQRNSFAITGDRLELKTDHAGIILSFEIERAAESFITGIFREQNFFIGDKKSRVEFQVESIEKLAEPVFEAEMSFRTISPAVISKQREHNKPALYLCPGEDDFKRIFFDNLIKKFIAAGFRKGNGEEYNKKMTVEPEMKLEISGTPKSRLIKIKAGTPQETFIRGFMFGFKICAPLVLMKLGYNAGFGEKNSLGFGCVDVLNRIK